MAMWTQYRDGKYVRPGEVVNPDQRLSWPRTIGIGAQHVVAMFGATFLVPLLTGFSPATTLFFSGIGTLLFLVITRGRVPSYLGSSFAFIAPIGAATVSSGQSAAVGGILVVGVLLMIVGVIVHFAGARWIDRVMPPAVTGTIVALIGFNLAPAAWNNVQQAPATAIITIATVALVTVLFRGILGRLAILIGVILGYVVAAVRGELFQGPISRADLADAPWFGLPDFTTPTFEPQLLGLFVPVVLVLIAENIGHVKSVASMTGDDLDDVTGRALFADGLATTLAGTGGGSGTTTYAENIGVMAATRVYSTAAYVVAGAAALALSLSPKVGVAIGTIPVGVLGGAGTILYGMIGLLGARIWIQNKVDFSDPAVLTSAAVALVAGIANFTFVTGDLLFEGIAVGTAAALGIYHGMKALARWRGTAHEAVSPSSVPDTVGPTGADAPGADPTGAEPASSPEPR